MDNFVVGFAFDDNNNVALIRKNRPDWQRGWLNGVGGHVEPFESSHTAMVREFEEETSVVVPNWVHYVNLHGSTFICQVFRSHHVDLSQVKTTTDEKVEVFEAEDLNQYVGVMPNVKWLIAMALDSDPRALVHVRYP